MDHMGQSEKQREDAGRRMQEISDCILKIMCYTGGVAQFNSHCRVDTCALSAAWTGSCQADEKIILRCMRRIPLHQKIGILSPVVVRGLQRNRFHKGGNFL